MGKWKYQQYQVAEVSGSHPEKILYTSNKLHLETRNVPCEGKKKYCRTEVYKGWDYTISSEPCSEAAAPTEATTVLLCERQTHILEEMTIFL